MIVRPAFQRLTSAFIFLFNSIDSSGLFLYQFGDSQGCERVQTYFIQEERAAPPGPSRAVSDGGTALLPHVE